MSGPHLYKNRVKDTTTTTGTGNVTLSGTAPTGYQTFNAAFGTNTRFDYVIVSADESEWEVGEGYLSASTTLVREEVESSSNSDALVNFSAGTKSVFSTLTARDMLSRPTRGRAYAYARGMALP